MKFAPLSFLYCFAVLAAWVDGSSDTHSLRGPATTNDNRRTAEFEAVSNFARPSVPLRVCQGDCDSDQECAEGLECFQRNGSEDVPGCKGGDDFDTYDYCIIEGPFQKYEPPPTIAPTTLTPIQVIIVDTTSSTSTTDSSTSTFPSPVPINYNSTSSDLDSTLLSNNATDDFTEPSDDDLVTGNMLDDDDEGLSFSDTVVLSAIEQESNEPSLPASPSSFDVLLGKCQGICKSDSDCSGDLMCFRRNLAMGGEVPFCTFDDATVKQSPLLLDFCTLPVPTTSQPTTAQPHPTQQPTPRLPTPAPTRPTYDLLALYWGNPPRDKEDGALLLRCEGDCDGDEDCEGDLICYNRDENDPVPGCYFVDDDEKDDESTSGRGMSIRNDTDVCIAPQDTFAPTKRPTLGPRTPWPTPNSNPNNGQPTILARFVGNPVPANSLGRCMADCDLDGDCKDDLICYRRSGGDDVPGCYFDATVDGAMDIEAGLDVCIDRASLLVSNVVRLRLYWEEGYDWQESSHETFWCMEEDNNSVQIHQCDSASIQKWEIQYQPTGEALLRSISLGNECLTGGAGRRAPPFFRTCNPQDPAQRWIPMNGGWDTKFELSRFGEEEECLSNDHHPRIAESVTMRGCRTERGYTTSQWTFY